MTQAPQMPKKWSSQDIGDLSGVTVLITGANSGLGLESAKALAAHDAQVIMAGRDPQRLAAALASVVGREPIGLHLDLADLQSVRAAAAEVGQQVDRLDVLINNAGIMATPFALTVDGFESQIGTNHLGHFALTGLLLPLLHHEGARVVNVSSTAHSMGSIDPDDLNFGTRSYSSWSAYGQSKIANLMFTSELDRRASEAGWDLVSCAAHPGYANTNLQFAGPGFAHNPIGRGLTAISNRIFGQDAEAGAWPQIFAAVGPDVRGNDYFGPDGIREMRGHPKRVGRTAVAADEDIASRLWAASELLTEVEFDWS